MRPLRIFLATAAAGYALASCAPGPHLEARPTAASGSTTVQQAEAGCQLEVTKATAPIVDMGMATVIGYNVRRDCLRAKGFELVEVDG
jgi:hypothetical protein